MFNLEILLRSSGMHLEKTLSIKEDHAVLQVQRGDTGSFLLRIYKRKVPAYQMMEQHHEEGFPFVYRTYEEEGFFVVEEELIEGVPLSSYLAANGPMNEGNAAKLLMQICRALHRLHKNGFIHRDMKPEHIILGEDQKVFLIDLDASMGISQEKRQDTQLIGTVVYAAPEQFGLTRSDVRSDIYALGILLNEMLTGLHPTVNQYRRGKLGRIIEICTKINPADRYQTLDALMEALELPAKYPDPTRLRLHKNTVIRLILAGVAAAAIFLGPLLLNEFIAVDGTAKWTEKPNAEILAMEGKWLQMYKYERMEDYSFVHRDGSQGARYYTEDGTLIDDSYRVYCDPQVGVVNRWIPETGGWDIISQNCDAGATGYLHAEKDGKHYAIDVQVLGESMSAYRSLPTLLDFTEGYLQSKQVSGQGPVYSIDYTYQRDELVTLYLAAAIGMDVLQVQCSSPLVNLERCEDYGLWNGPVYKLTFENPQGGDTWFTVNSNMNPLTFNMIEVLPPGQ